MGILYPNCLPIAITFNHKSQKSKVDYKLKDPDAIVAYSVCCRMLVAVYNITLEGARDRMDEALTMKGSESIKTDANSFAENLIDRGYCTTHRREGEESEACCRQPGPFHR